LFCQKVSVYCKMILIRRKVEAKNLYGMDALGKFIYGITSVEYDPEKRLSDNYKSKQIKRNRKLNGKQHTNTEST